MIGRGTLRNPFIFEQSRDLLKTGSYQKAKHEDYLTLLEDQRQVFSEYYDSYRTMIHARKFLSWYASGFPGCHEFRKKVFDIKDHDELWKESHDFFSRDTTLRNFGFLEESFLMGGHG
jgi:tRNA-dihydrouridine synthase